ncbi:MAG: DNA primase, partial [Firmicutes bacterium]|nr:DNA primase [Bacillota bacterium]
MSEYITLSKRGNTHWGCCPFHHEKAPSFAVNEDKQFYHCFGCKESGNAFTFIKKIESVEFGDALKILAKKLGLEVPKLDFRKSDSAEVQAKKERLRQLMREAAKHYHENLNSTQGNSARKYLEERGITKNLQTKFGLGLSLHGGEMLEYLRKLGYTTQEMKDAGIAAAKESEWYDVFYGRVMFPIIDQFGVVVGFGGRTLQKDADFAKYRNSSQTLLFDKSKTIYALNLLQKRKQRGKIDYVILCEGYMDVIALHAVGFDTAVAAMGTALTYNQAKKLKNFASRVYISFDGDGAGQKAALRSLDILAETGLSVRVIQLPEGIDPDDLVKSKGGAEKYKTLMNNALTLPAFKIASLQKQYDLNDKEEKTQFTIEAVRVVKTLQNPVEQEEYLDAIAKTTGYALDVLRRQADKPVPEKVMDAREDNQAEQQREQEKNKEESAKQFVLASICAQKDFVDFTEDFASFLTDEFSQEVANFIIANRKENIESVASLYTRIDENMDIALTDILHYGFIESDDKKRYDDCVKNLKITVLQREKEAIAQDMQESKDFSRLPELSDIEQKLNR